MTDPTGGGEQSALTAMIGLAAGFSSAFLGIGGGLVLVPALTLLLRCPIKQAVGTSLATVLFISIAGVMAEWEVSGAHFQWTSALVLGLGSLLGSALSGRVIARIPDNPIRLALAGVLLTASVRMSTGWLGPKGVLATLISGTPAVGHLLILMVGMVAGVTSVLFGVGGGIVTVPGLGLFCADLPFNTIRGTSLVAIVVAAAIGARQHARLGHVDERLTKSLVPAGLAGAVLGVVAAAYFPTRLCQIGFAALLAFVAVRLLGEVFRPSGMGGWPSRLGRGGRRAGANAP